MANKNKATHTGECQCCGRRQMLPHGVLSKHGYTTKWGFFSGVCQGAHHQPFELSCDLIKSFIDYAELQLVGIKQQQAAARVPATEPKAWRHHYVEGKYNGSRYIRGHYEWRMIDIITTSNKSQDGTYEWNTYSYVTEDGESHRLDNYGESGKSALTFANSLNEQYAKSFDSKIGEIEQYIKWQTERVNNWKEQPLTPIT